MFDRTRWQEITENIGRYKQPILIALSVDTVLAHDLVSGLPRSVTIFLIVGFPIFLSWFWGRATGLGRWQDDKTATVMLILWAAFILFGIIYFTTRDDQDRTQLCRSYLKVMKTTPLAAPAKVDSEALSILNAASSAASALKCWT
jgi:hypothetical protein